MRKFVEIRRPDLVEGQDPVKEGGITFVLKKGNFLHVKVVDEKIETKSVQNN